MYAKKRICWIYFKKVIKEENQVSKIIIQNL